MSLNAVFSLLKSRNIALLEEEGELVIRAPQGAMDEDLLAQLKLHKQGLLTALRNGHDVSITPQMLTLVELSQEEIDAIVANVDGGGANIQDIYPLAPLQEGILFHHLLESQGDPYVTRTQIVFENRRYLDHFLAALQTVIERHDILRSAMHWQGLRQPVQVVQRRAKLPVHDLSGGDAEARLSAATDPRQWRMNLQQAPLLHVYIAAEQDGSGWRLVLLNHHLIDDNYTLQLVLSEIRLLLAGRGGELPAPLPYRNFIARMRRTSQAEHEAYFREQLGDVYETTAPFGLLNVQGDGGKVEESTLRLDTELSRRIRDTARSFGVSPAGLMHAAWAVVMGRCSGRDDVVFGTVLSGRLHGGAGAERAVGMFINTLPIRVPLGRYACREVVALTHRRLNSLLAHEQASLATAQRCSAVPSGMPLFTTLINYRHAAIVDADDKALTAWEGARVLFSEERSNYPLTLTVDDFGDNFALTVQAAPGIDPLRIAGYVRTVVEGLVEALRHDPDKTVAEIAMLSAAEKRQLLSDWNATACDYPEVSCLQGLFETQAERMPNAVALSFEDKSLTYAELNAKANQLAHYLMAQGVGPEVLVGICIERSLEMVIGLLGILKAGGAYVPLDPHYPEERLRYMLDDAGVSLLLTRSDLAELTDFDRLQMVYLDDDWLQAAFYPAHNLDVRNRPQDLAYIIYTSGSTGRPKGVAVTHGNALHSTQARFAYYADPVKAYLLLSSFAFDSSVAGIFWTLGQGGCLCLPSEEMGKDPAALADLIERRRVSHLLALPSLYGLLLEQTPERLNSLKAAIVAGEACANDVVKRHVKALPGVKLYNEYGPTEGTVWSSVYPVGLDDLDRPLAIGRPIGNVRLYILDSYLNPAPVGVAGELYIGGAGIVRGYLNRPALSAERFIPDPFQAGGGRLYKTGDLARYRADGAIEFLGRIDQQVKIRGFRIELGEIEAQLLAHPEVKEAVVLAREDQPGDKRLVAYLVEDQLGTLVIDELKAHLKQALPDYMVPTAFVVLDEMPLSANGKLDRKRLPAADLGKQLSKLYVAPRTETETILAEIWQQVLGIEQVGVEDDFFELGGHSLLATQLAFAVQNKLRTQFPVKAVFEKPTVGEQAGWLSGEADEESIDLQVEAGLGSDILPLPAKPAELGQSRALMLTGSTGFLGAFLLADLLEQTQAHVYCLIRAADEAQASSRLEKQLARYDLLERIDWRRVIPVCGDLASERLGLSEDRYREIAAGVDAIFHNGAQVNFVQPYRALKAANVSGSVEVLRLATTERPKAIHYVSTLSVFAGNPSNPQGFTETDEPRFSGALVGGYAQSKWVAEAILRKASLRGFQVAVYRPATVAGDSHNGVWNTDDFLCRVFKGCIQMGLAPEVDSRLDMAPVDFVSGAIVALAQETDVAGSIFHLNHPHPPTANAWFDWFIVAGFPLRKVSTRQWRAAMLAAAETIADFALAPLLTLFAEEAESDGAADRDEAVGYDCSATQGRLAARGMAYQSIEDTLLARYRDYFVRSGWIDAGKIEKNGE
jgi:amino acid adenylation domain-containing protein/thioester reductase-like protein